MPWDTEKCKWGTPAGFKFLDAAKAVTSADFAHPVFVQISEKEENTKKVFTYYNVKGYRICVVADIHKGRTSGRWDQPGNSYIPGWEKWSIKTPDSVVAVAGGLPESGVFPGDDRYPHPL